MRLHGDASLIPISPPASYPTHQPPALLPYYTRYLPVYRYAMALATGPHPQRGLYPPLPSPLFPSPPLPSQREACEGREGLIRGPSCAVGREGPLCQPCAPGRFKRTEGGGACKPCAKGSYAAALGSGRCQPCRRAAHHQAALPVSSHSLHRHLVRSDMCEWVQSTWEHVICYPCMHARTRAWIYI